MTQLLRGPMSQATTPRLRPSAARRVAVAVVLALLGVQLAVVGLAAPAQAAVVRPFDPVFSVNTNGDIMLVGNTLETCAAGANCTTARDVVNGPAGSNSNNNFSSAYVDVDGLPETFNSSSADLDLPAGSAVLFAALVWGGRVSGTNMANADAALRGNARMTVKNAAGSTVHDLVASRVDASGLNYASYLDVTDIVAGAGDAKFTLANVQAAVGGTDQYAGWSLVVAVADPSAPARNLTIFNGYGSVAGGDTTPTTFDVDGFLTPPSGPVRTTLGVVTFEGDMGLQGDALQLNGTTIWDTNNPAADPVAGTASNPFNSTITNRGNPVTTRNPAYANQLGIDIDLFDADAVLGNSATSASIALSTSGDAYLPTFVTFATDLYDPKLLGTKTVTDLDGGDVLPGDTLEYRIPVENIGLDTSSQSRFFDAIPTGTTFVPGSVTVGTATQTIAQTDALDGDTTRYVADGNGYVEVFLGAGATPTQGGDIPMSSGAAQYVVTFQVRVDADATKDQELINAAVLSYRGMTTYASSASATNAVISPVVTTLMTSNTPPDATPHILSFTPSPVARSLNLDVLADDTDPDGDMFALVGMTAAAGGAVTVNASPTLNYAPRDDFAGRDVFTYTIEDSAGNRSTATVQVEVINTAPDAVDDAVTVPGATPAVLDLLVNDTDPNGDALAVRSADPVSAQGGAVTVTNGGATYTPAPGFRGTDTFTYVLGDARGGSDTATVTITVTNNAPVALDDTESTPSGTAVSVPVLVNDSDPDGDTLTVSVASAPAHGAVAIQSDGGVRYTPAVGWAGADAFTYTVTDGGGLQDTATVTVTTANANPVARADAVSTATDTAVSDVDVLGNDTDVNVTAGLPGQALTVTGATADHGATVVVAADSTLTVTPAPGYSGTVTVTYTLSDGAGGTATGILTVTVDNGAPSAISDGPALTPTSTALVVDVLANDTDPNTADTLSIVPGSLTAPVDGGGTTRGTVAIDAGAVLYTPPTGWAGTVTFTYDVTDGNGATVTGTATVVVINGDPDAVDDTTTTSSGTAATVDVLANDSDANVPGTTQQLAVIGAVADNGATVVVNPDGTLTVTPVAGFEGIVTVAYTVGDGVGGSDAATLRLTVANAAPVARADTGTTPYRTPVSVDLVANDTDANPGDILSVVPGSVTTPVDSGGTSRGTVTVTGGKASYTPPTGFSGEVTFRYAVTDGTDQTVTTVTITVSNAAPVSSAKRSSASVRTTSRSSMTIDVLADLVDLDGGTLTIVGVTQPESGTVAIVDGRLVYTPEPGYTGTVTFTYTVSDGQGGLTTSTVTVDVGPVGTTQSALARTGAQVAGLVGLAALLLAVGSVLLLGVRRHRRV